MAVAAGNLWLVLLATFTLQRMVRTNHIFPAAMATGVPCEMKSTVIHDGEVCAAFVGRCRYQYLIMFQWVWSVIYH